MQGLHTPIHFYSWATKSKETHTPNRHLWRPPHADHAPVIPDPDLDPRVSPPPGPLPPYAGAVKKYEKGNESVDVDFGTAPSGVTVDSIKNEVTVHLVDDLADPNGPDAKLSRSRPQFCPRKLANSNSGKGLSKPRGRTSLTANQALAQANELRKPKCKTSRLQEKSPS